MSAFKNAPFRTLKSFVTCYGTDRRTLSSHFTVMCFAVCRELLDIHVYLRQGKIGRTMVKRVGSLK